MTEPVTQAEREAAAAAERVAHATSALAAEAAASARLALVTEARLARLAVAADRPAHPREGCGDHPDPQQEVPLR